MFCRSSHVGRNSYFILGVIPTKNSSITMINAIRTALISKKVSALSRLEFYLFDSAESADERLEPDSVMSMFLNVRKAKKRVDIRRSASDFTSLVPSSSAISLNHCRMR